MTPSLQTLISFILLVCTLSVGNLNANITDYSCSETIECQDVSTAARECAEENPCYSPQWYNSYNITQNSAILEWEPVYGAYYYTVQWRYPGGSWYNYGGNCYQTWINMSNMNPCTQYEWRVRSHCSYNYSSPWCYPNYFTTLCEYCPTVDWQSCYDITDHSATWKWAGVYGADYYMIQWHYPGGGWYDLAGGPFHGTWVNVDHLSPCTNYEWRVKSFCHYGGWSNWSNPYAFSTTCHNVCPVPGGLITQNIGDTKATFKWTPVYGAHTYSVQIRDAWGYWWDVPGSPTAGIWITAYNLTPCKTYEWRVKANCGYYSSSNWSHPKAFTTTCGHGCYAPEWVLTNGVTSSSALLHWGSVIGADSYIVEWRTPNGQWQHMAVTSNTVVELTGLHAQTTYEWRVRASCHGNLSNYSYTTHFTTLGSTCGMPFYRYTLPITDSTATFNWSAVSGAVSYTVQIRLFNGTWSDVPGSPTTGTSITATGLAPNTMYEWRMQVNCSNGAHSIWLSPVMFVTGSSTGCHTPGSLFAHNITLTSALLTWGAVQGAETYSVEIRVAPHGAWVPVPGSPVNTNSIFHNSLAPHTTYEWRVRANCAGGLHSFWSGASHFVTNDNSACHAPVNLYTDSITQTTGTLHWSAVAGVQGYEVQIRLPNGIWIDVGGLVTGTSLLAQGLTAHTTYEWRVRSKCDAQLFSNWSPSIFFTTAGSGLTNDECLNATLLTVSTTCVPVFASNVDATASNPAPVGGCNSISARDVWFKFTMPNVSNSSVTIRTGAGSLANAVMEIYAGNDCNFLSVITCEDNNDNGNGSTMPVINLTGTANSTIWVRVWGFEGSTGTFTICVMDNISFDNAQMPQVNIADVGEELEVFESDVIDTEQLHKSAIHVSPNPVNDVLNIDVHQTEECNVVSLRLIDLSGKITHIQTQETAAENNFRTKVDVSNLVPGLYLLQVQTACGIMTERITVIR